MIRGALLALWLAGSVAAAHEAAPWHAPRHRGAARRLAGLFDGAFESLDAAANDLLGLLGIKPQTSGALSAARPSRPPTTPPRPPARPAACPGTRPGARPRARAAAAAVGAAASAHARATAEHPLHAAPHQRRR